MLKQKNIRINFGVDKLVFRAYKDIRIPQGAYKEINVYMVIKGRIFGKNKKSNTYVYISLHI